MGDWDTYDPTDDEFPINLQPRDADDFSPPVAFGGLGLPEL
jgi:hypothetical protein